MDYPSFESMDFNFRRSFITLWDFPVLILFLILGFVIFNSIRKKSKGVYGARSSVFLSAFLLHCLGSIFITLIYSYYYKGGDTTAYFNDARLLHKVFWNNPVTALDIFFSSSKTLLVNHPYIYNSFRFVASPDTFMVVKICFVLQFFSFNLILPTALLFGFLSFYASWKFYLIACRFYPHLAKILTIPFFFIPGVHVWGSGIFKDTISLALIYFILISIIELKRTGHTFTLVKFIILIYLLFVIKIYILMTLLLGFSCYFIAGNLKKVRNVALKTLAAPALITLGVLGFFFSFKYIGDNSKRGIYSMDQILERAEIVSSYLGYVSEKSDGSSYNLGIESFTIPNLASKMPAAINVTLFRPYFWEVRNPLMLAAALESLLIFFFTLYVIYKVGLVNFFSNTIRSPIIFSMLVYCFSFAFAIGITSSNFGTLTRYKIPIIPFYVIALILILYSNRSSRIKSSNGFLKAGL
ncbi:MAG: hypothetical protein ABJG47_20310 [Ekhidna sp.]